MRGIRTGCRWLIAISLAALVGCGGPEIDEELVTLNNRGVALMGKFEYGKAHEVFSQVVDRAPDWTLARENLAVATLNRQEPGDEQAALAMLESLMASEPGALRAHYMAGILQFNAGNSEQALRHFQTVATADPEDAYAQYFTAQSLLQMGQPEQAVRYFEKAAELDPYLRSAAYGLFLARQQLRDREGARAALADYEKLENNPRSRLAEIRYTRMGPKAMATALRAPRDPGPSGRPEGPLFAAPQPLTRLAVQPQSAATLFDGKSGTLAVATAAGVALCPLPGGCAEPVLLPDTEEATATAWGDFDNDGLTDLYVGRNGENRLLRASPDGGWLDVTASSGTAGTGNTSDVAFIDADHDGDLDLLLAQSDTASELLSNNGDGTFRPLREFTGPLIAARQVLAADLDADRDLDLVLLAASPPHQVLLNDRLWQYRPAGDDWRALLDRPITAAVVADLDVDGWPELVALEPARLTLWKLNGKNVTEYRSLPLDSRGVDSPNRLWLTDATGQGVYQALVNVNDGWALLDLEEGTSLATGQGAPLLVLNGVAGAGLLTTSDRQISLLPPGPGRWPVTLLQFSGQDDVSQSMRSNASGLGTAFVARSRGGWVAGQSLEPSAAPGQSLQPALVGSAGSPVQSVAIDWSDGVFQSEVDLQPGQVHRITETQRQLASCPVLFVDHGEGWQFMTDVLGVGGIGFNTGFGQYAQPRPRETLLLDVTANVERPPRLLVAEPMEESAYLDHVSMTAVDLPPGWQVVLDERMGTGAPAVTGELIWFRDGLAPQSAVGYDGQSVLEAVTSRDLNAAPLPDRDRQLAGLLQERQVLTVAFGQDLSQWPAPVLVFDGWVEYGYSQTSFAAWQQGRRYDALSLEIQVDGQWRDWRPGFGYPAGMPRAAALPLGRLPAGTRQLRLSTDQQIYLDRIAIVASEAPPDYRSTRLDLAGARLRRIGYPRRENGPQMQPYYDFSSRDTFWDTRYPSGLYTRLGDVRELVVERDNALAIVGPGDGLELEFDRSQLPPLPDGWSRRWMVRFDGWAKDMDLLTRDGETVGPLPSAEVAEDRAAELHARYNLRFLQGQ